MSCPDINEQINIEVEETNLNPRFAASCNKLFYTFVENNTIKLRYSEDLGNSFSTKQEIMQLQGPANFLRIAAREDMAVIIALEQTASGIKVKGVTGKIKPPPEVFQFTECPTRDLPSGSTFNNIIDVIIRINDDETSDDVVFLKTGAGANVVATGHHPNPPQ